MKTLPVAVFEPAARIRTRIVDGLRRAGLKVTDAQSPEGLKGERLLVVGPGVPQPARLIRTLRTSRPELVVLAAQQKDAPARWANAVLPLPISPRDLKARLPELAPKLPASPPTSAPAPAPGPAVLDPLTGFYAFPHFRQLLFVEVKRARRYGFPLSVALLAFDPLPLQKTPALRTQMFGGLALAVRRSLRDTDFPVQYGERRVLLLMPHTPLQGAVVVTRRIVDRVARAELPYEGQVLHPTISIGLSAYSPGVRELSFSDLVRQAQQSLLSAMRSGGNRVEFFDVAEQAANDEAQLDEPPKR